MKPLAKTKDLVVKRDTGELFIEDLVKNTEIHLNPTSAYVWEKCDEKRSVKEIADEMEFELGMNVSESVVEQAIAKLRSEDLISEMALTA